MKETKRSVTLGSMRIPFLVLPPTCVGLGLAVALHSGSSINILHLALVFLGAVFAHISVNTLNEYDDFKTGLDFKTIKTPFSGGSKTLPENPDKAHHALILGISTLILTIVIGLYFLHIRGFMLLPIGLSGIFIVAAYTKWIIKSPILCLISLSIVTGWLLGVLPVLRLISLICTIPAIHTFIGVKHNADSIPNLIPFMGKTVVLMLATHILLAIGMIC